MTGDYAFTWRFLLEREDGTVQGQSLGLKGQVRPRPGNTLPEAGDDFRSADASARILPFAIAIGIWLVPVPAGLTAPAWHLFAIFVAAIAAVLVGAFRC